MCRQQVSPNAGATPTQVQKCSSKLRGAKAISWGVQRFGLRDGGTAIRARSVACGSGDLRPYTFPTRNAKYQPLPAWHSRSTSRIGSRMPLAGLWTPVSQLLPKACSSFGVLTIRGPFFEGPHSQEYRILVPIFGALFRATPI